MKANCANCAFWVKGECRDKVPVPVPLYGDLQLVAIWPRTRADHWCGEWKTRGGTKDE